MTNLITSDDISLIQRVTQTEDNYNGHRYVSPTKSILVVDDEYDIVNLLKQSLLIDGFKVSVFTDPLIALVHFVLHFNEYGVVISDIGMPSMNGYEFVKHIKKISPKVKIILLSIFEIEDKEFLNVL